MVLRPAFSACLSFSETLAGRPSENFAAPDSALGFFAVDNSVAVPVKANVSRLVSVSATALRVTLPTLTLTGVRPNTSFAAGGGGVVPPGPGAGGCTTGPSPPPPGGGVVQSAVRPRASPRSAACRLPAKSRACTSNR